MYDVCVVGLGAIGAIYSLILERSGKARVTAVCRSNYRVLLDSGLNIVSAKFGTESAWRPYRVVATPEEAADRQYEFVICCFNARGYHYANLIQALLSKTKTYVLIQNGVGIHEDLQRAVPAATIISACAWIDTTAVDGGRTVNHNDIERLTLGIHGPSMSVKQENGLGEQAEKDAQASLACLVDLLNSGGGDVEPVHNIEAERWRKVLWNASYSTICTLTRSSVPRILSVEQTQPVLVGLMNEVMSVARAVGIDSTELPEAAVNDIITSTDGIYREGPAGTMPPNQYRPSMLVDLDSGRPMEVEAIVGGVIRKARELGSSTPQLDVVYASLKVIQITLLKSQRGF